MKLNFQIPYNYLLKPVRVFQRKSQLSRPACCYEPEDVQVLQKLARQLEQCHPDKTFTGGLSRGFDALGYQFSEEAGLTGPSATAVQLFGARIAERYVQHESRESLLQYVDRWLNWQFGYFTPRLVC